MAFIRSSKTNRSPPNNGDESAGAAAVESDLSKQFSCPDCDRCDDINMVQCDMCDSWHHLVCVGVTAAISDYEWICESCKLKVEQHVGSAKGSNSTSSSKRRINLELKRLEEERLLAEARDAEEREARAKARDRARAEEEAARKEAEIDKQKRDKDYLERKYQLLNEGSQGGSSKGRKCAGAMHDSHERTNSWVKRQRELQERLQELTGNRVHDPAAPPPPEQNRYNGPRFGLPTPPQQQRPVERHDQHPRFSHEQVAAALGHINANLPQPEPQPVQQAPAYVSNPRVGRTPVLNSAHVAARHIVSKELPIFSGKPEDWPLFISSYETSTETCNFSDSENLIRLQRCLKGKALEAVRFRLLLPAMVPDVIRTLRTLYGRPEVIIHMMLQKIRLEPSPKPEKLETLVTYALAVQNFCATIEASGLQAHLNNPSLLMELVEKLPTQFKVTWAVYTETVPVVTLSTFGTWLYDLAMKICTVTMPSFESNPGKDKHQERGFFHTHSEEQVQSSFVSSKPRGECRICDQECKEPQDCVAFNKLSYNGRWNVVKRCKLCRTCLGRHNQFSCKSRAKCGKDGCQFRHHPLLCKKFREEKPETDAVEPEPNVVCTTHQSNQQVLFCYIPVTIYGRNTTVNVCFLRRRIVTDVDGRKVSRSTWSGRI